MPTARRSATLVLATIVACVLLAAPATADTEDATAAAAAVATRGPSFELLVGVMGASVVTAAVAVGWALRGAR